MNSLSKEEIRYYTNKIRLHPEYVNKIITHTKDFYNFKELLLSLIKLPGVKRYLFLDIEDKEILEDLIKEDPETIRYIKNPSEDLCILAMEYHYKPEQLFRYAIEPKYQTDKICLYAVNKCGMVLNKVVNQTDEICLAAVKQSGLALRYVKNKTEEICVEAIKQNPNAIKHIDDITPNIYIGSIVGKIQELDDYIGNNNQLKVLEETIIRMILAMKK